MSRGSGIGLVFRLRVCFGSGLCWMARTLSLRAALFTLVLRVSAQLEINPDVLAINYQNLLGYAGAGAASDPVPLTAKPEIPQLVYWGPGQSGTFKDNEVEFNGGSTAARLAEADVPDSFQYRVNCGEDTYSPTNQWVSDAKIAYMVARTTCKQLLSAEFIRLRTHPTEQTVRNIRLIPVPATQTWNGVQLQQSRTGINRNRVSTCCDSQQCTSVCLEFPAAKQCNLEFYTVAQGAVYDESVGADIARFFGGVSLTTRGGAFLYPRFRIPCDYCPLTNCIANCSNGQFSTGYTDIVVRTLSACRGVR